MIIKKVIRKLSMYKNPISYARKIGVKVGDGCKFVSPPNWGSEPWLIEIGNHVEISGSVSFVTHDGSTWVIRDEEEYKNVIKFGRIIVGDNSFIGIGSIILPGVTIGKNAIVGAGSIVTKSVPDNTVYAGNPAHFIMTIDEYKKKCLANTPDYDVEEFKKNKKQTVLNLLK